MWGTAEGPCTAPAVLRCYCFACSAGGRQDFDLVEFRFVEDVQAVLFRCGSSYCGVRVY